MNPIDNDRSGLSLIQALHARTEHTVADKTDSGAMVKKTETNQLRDLLSVIKDAFEPASHLDKLNQIKAAINADSYVIDFDGLAHNILVSEYEL